MNRELMEKCYEFLAAQRICRKSQGIFGHRQLDPVCAGILISSSGNYDEEKIRLCRQLVQDNNGMFSMFRGITEPVLAAYLATDDFPVQKLQAAGTAYRILKDYFSASNFLPLTAMFMTDFCEANDFRRAAEDTKYIHKEMQSEHFFLTGNEDVLFAFLISRTSTDYPRTLRELEYIYEKLKMDFLFSRNSLQSLCHALALCSGSPDDKIIRTRRLKQKLDEKGLSIGRGYELISLGILANLGVDFDQMLLDIQDVSAFLNEEEEYRGFFGFSEKSRLMHAVLILMAYYMTAGPELIAAVVVGAVIEIQNQQAAAAAA